MPTSRPSRTSSGTPSGLRRVEFEPFRERERGYRLTEVDPDQIDPYAPDDFDAPIDTTRPPLDEQDLTLVTTGKKVDHNISPIPGYCRQCLDGANQWGETFLAEFETTTASNPGTDMPTAFRE